MKKNCVSGWLFTETTSSLLSGYLNFRISR